MRLTTLTCSLAFLGITACTGGIPERDNADAAPPEADAPPAGDEMVAVNGKTMDYFALTPTPLAATNVVMEDVVPEVNNTSDALGDYALQVPPGSTAYAIATHTAYRPTRNVPTVTVTPDLPVTQDLYVASVQESANLYNNAVGGPIDMDLGTAIVIGDLRRDNGEPFDNVAIADVSLVDLATPPAPVVGIDGPYFFTADGLIDPAITVGTALDGALRVAVLNCPLGNYQLRITYINGMGNAAEELAPVICDADSFTLVRTGTAGGGDGGGGGGGNITNPTFTEHIYPRLQTPAVSEGNVGRACTGCHNAARLAAGTVPIAYDGPAADVYAAIMAMDPPIVDPAAPVASLLLTKPLRELTPPQNHPNVTFLNETDADYIIFMTWIQQGAVLGP